MLQGGLGRRLYCSVAGGSGEETILQCFEFLTNVVTDQIHVDHLPSLPCDGVVNDRARRRVIQSFGSSAKDPSGDAFLHNHHSQLRLVVPT